MGVDGRGRVGGGQGGCDRRIEVFRRNSKKNGGGRGRGVRLGGRVRVDVNEEVFVKIQKKIFFFFFFFFGGGGQVGGRVGGLGWM